MKRRISRADPGAAHRPIASRLNEPSAQATAAEVPGGTNGPSPFSRLALGVTEIRQYGASGIQVMRAPRAMLEELREDVRTEHRAAVEKEFARVASTVAARWDDSVDLDGAMIADGQGIGGPGLAAGAGP